MNIINLTEKEFEKFAYNHEQTSFIQTIYFAKLKEKNGWNYEILGVKNEKGKVVLATILLYKKVIFNKKMYYAPRGFITDYNNKEFMDEFIKEIKTYLKKNNAIFLKIDPYIIHYLRNSEGEIKENSIDNSNIINYLKSIGFKEQCKKEGQQRLQANWMYRLDLRDKTFDDVTKDMNSSVKRFVKKNEKNGVYLREGSYEEFNKFNDVLNHTSKRRNFLSRNLEYFQDMYKIFGDGKIVKLYFVELKVKEKLDEFIKEKDVLVKNYDQLIYTIKNTATKVSEEKIKEKENEIDNITKKVQKYQKIYDEKGDIAVLSAVLYINFGEEVISFIGGDYEEYLDFQPFTTMHYEMIQYAIDNKYSYYNMYTISPTLSKDDPMYGVYEYKKKFGGEIVQLIGEFDLKISAIYYIYKIAYFFNHKLQKIKKTFKK